MAAPAFVAAVSLDGPFDTGGTAMTVAFDAGSAADRIIINRNTWRDVGSHTIAAVTYNSIALSQFGARVDVTPVRGHMFYLVAPASGSNTASVDPSTGSASGDSVMDWIVFDNVDQITPYDGYATANGTDTSMEGTVASATGDTPVYTGGMRGSVPISVSASLYTSRLNNNQGQVMSSIGEGTGDASVACVGTIVATVTSAWITMVCNLNVASAAASIVPILMAHYRRMS